MLDEKDIQIIKELLNEQKEDTARQFLEVNRKLEEYRSEFSEINRKLEEYRGEFTEVNCKLEEYRGELTEHKLDSESRFKALEDKTDRLEQLIRDQKDEMVRESAHIMRVIVESEITPTLKLLLEGYNTLLETLAPKSRVEKLENEVGTLKTIVKLHSEEISELKKAQ